MKIIREMVKEELVILRVLNYGLCTSLATAAAVVNTVNISIGKEAATKKAVFAAFQHLLKRLQIQLQYAKKAG